MTDNRTTERLMAMLEERGVKYELEHDLYVEWVDARGNDVTAFKTSCKHKGDVLIVHVFLTPEQAIAATLGSGVLTAEQVRETVEKHWHDLPDEYDMPEATALPEYSYDWQAIADDLNAGFENDDDYERKMDTLLCRLTNGKWSKSRAYSIEFMDACISEEFEALYSEEQFSAPVSGTLTAEQVREAIMSADRWEKPMGNTGLTNAHLIIRDDGWQAIADELNAELGSETCVVTHDFKCSNCGKQIGVVRNCEMYETCDGQQAWKSLDNEVCDIPNFCQNCGAKVVGK